VSTAAKTEANVKQAVPFFIVTNIERSVRFYVDGLGFEMTEKWVPEGRLRWCWLQLGGAALMLQKFLEEKRLKLVRDAIALGVGVSIGFICEDALAFYREISSRGINAERPFVGNGMWVTSMSDPDGYKIFFESYTDVPEETVYTGEEG